MALNFVWSICRESKNNKAEGKLTWVFVPANYVRTYDSFNVYICSHVNIDVVKLSGSTLFGDKKQPHGNSQATLIDDICSI